MPSMFENHFTITKVQGKSIEYLDGMLKCSGELWRRDGEWRVAVTPSVSMTLDAFTNPEMITDETNHEPLNKL